MVELSIGYFFTRGRFFLLHAKYMLSRIRLILIYKIKGAGELAVVAYLVVHQAYNQNVWVQILGIPLTDSLLA